MRSMAIDLAAPVRITDTPAWAALMAHHETVRDRPCATCSRRPGARPAADARSGRAVPRLLEAARDRRDDARSCSRWRARPASRSAGTRCSAGEHINITEDRAVLHIALRCRRGRAAAWSTARTSSARSTRCSTGWPRSPQACAHGEWKGITGKPIRNVVNIGIGGSDLGPAMATQALRALRASGRCASGSCRNVDGTDLREATIDLDPAETLFIVASKTFTTLETLTNARTAREWLLAGLGGDERPSRSTSSPCRRTREKVARVRHRHRATCSGSGTGSAAATRWTRRSACRSCSPSAPTTSARCSPASRRWTSTSAPTPLDQNLPVHPGPARRLVPRTASASRPTPCCPTAQELDALPGLPPAAGHGVQRQVACGSTARRSTYDTGPIVWGTAGHQRPARLLPAAPPGHDGSCPPTSSASSTRRPSSATTRTCCWRTCSPRPRRWRSARRATRSSRTGVPAHQVDARVFAGQPADVGDPRRPADAADPRARSSRSTSTRCSCRARSGASTRSTSGASSWARCSRRRIAAELLSAEEPVADLHDPSTTRLIRRVRSRRDRTPA